MGISYELGPPADSLDPRSPDGLDPWRGERPLSPAQLGQLVRVIENAGWTVEGRAGEYSVTGRADTSERGAFEDLSLSADGGWISNPSLDDEAFDEIFSLLETICDYAGWLVYSPETHCIAYGVEVRCQECYRLVEPASYTCDGGHPAAEAAVKICVEPPPAIESAVQAVDRSTPPRTFRHPDGRTWSIELADRDLHISIELPDGQRIARTRKVLDPDSGARELDSLVAEQIAGGFVET